MLRFVQINRTSQIVGQRVQQLRRGQWSQADLARLLGEKLGKLVDPTTITRLEGGKRPVTVDELVALSEIFNVPVNELFEDPDVIRYELERWTELAASTQNQIELFQNKASEARRDARVAANVKTAWGHLESYRRAQKHNDLIEALSLLSEFAAPIFGYENLTDHDVVVNRPMMGLKISAFSLVAALSAAGVDGAILNKSWHTAVQFSIDGPQVEEDAPGDFITVNQYPAEMFVSLVLEEVRRK